MRILILFLLATVNVPVLADHHQADEGLEKGENKVCFLGYRGQRILKDMIDYDFPELASCRKGDVVAFCYEKMNYGSLIAAAARVCKLSETHVLIEDARKGLICTFTGKVLPIEEVKK